MEGQPPAFWSPRLIYRLQRRGKPPLGRWYQPYLQTWRHPSALVCYHPITHSLFFQFFKTSLQSNTQPLSLVYSFFKWHLLHMPFHTKLASPYLTADTIFRMFHITKCERQRLHLQHLGNERSTDLSGLQQ